jgi:hypothetical protein
MTTSCTNGTPPPPKPQNSFNLIHLPPIMTGSPLPKAPVMSLLWGSLMALSEFITKQEKLKKLLLMHIPNLLSISSGATTAALWQQPVKTEPSKSGPEMAASEPI